MTRLNEVRMQGGRISGQFICNIEIELKQNVKIRNTIGKSVRDCTDDDEIQGAPCK
jgi:hypothetical protein